MELHEEQWTLSPQCLGQIKSSLLLDRGLSDRQFKQILQLPGLMISWKLLPAEFLTPSCPCCCHET